MSGCGSIVEDQLSVAGRLQTNTALSIMDTLTEHLDRLRRRLERAPVAEFMDDDRS